jgi:hypothetical protein
MHRDRKIPVLGRALPPKRMTFDDGAAGLAQLQKFGQTRD